MSSSNRSIDRIKSMKKTFKIIGCEDSFIDDKLLAFLSADEIAAASSSRRDDDTASLSSSSSSYSSSSRRGDFGLDDSIRSSQYSLSSQPKEETTTTRSRIRNRPSSVKFDKIKIRTYNRTVVEHPSCVSGVPMGLSWEYDPSNDIEYSVDRYETIRCGERKRNKRDLYTTEDERYNLLLECDVPVSEIKKYWVD